MVAAAIVGAGVVGAGATVVASQSAASAQENAANQAIAAQQGYFNTAQQAQQPFISAGQNAIPEISQLEGIPYYDANGNLVQPTPGEMQSTLEQMPGYQFANYQGLKSVQNSASARGLGISGAAQKGAANYATGLANQYYNNLLTGLQSTENTGASAASSLSGAATQTGAEVGQNITGAANANAASQLATAQALSGAANSLPSALLSNQIVNSLYGKNSGTPGTSGAATALSVNPADTMAYNGNLGSFMNGSYGAPGSAVWGTNVDAWGNSIA